MEAQGPKDYLVVLLSDEAVPGVPERNVVSVDIICGQI